MHCFMLPNNSVSFQRNIHSLDGYCGSGSFSALGLNLVSVASLTGAFSSSASFFVGLACLYGWLSGG
jgi:hypothetical protein